MQQVLGIKQQQGWAATCDSDQVAAWAENGVGVQVNGASGGLWIGGQVAVHRHEGQMAREQGAGAGCLLPPLHSWGQV